MIEIATANREALQEVDGDQNLPEPSRKNPLTPQEVARLTRTPGQDARHRQARSNENFGIGMSSFLGATGVGCFGAVIYGLVKKDWLFAGGMGLAGAFCSVFSYASFATS